MSVQTKLQFQVRKNNFYGKKQNDCKPTPEQLSGILSTPSSRYTPTVRKIVDISSSSEESDSDSENIAKNNNITRTPKRKPPNRNEKDDTESSPPKQRKTPSKTPSTMLKGLRLLSPSKPDRLMPKSLFANNRYSDARKALHSALPEDLTGREEEMAKMTEFIEDHLNQKTSASMYISGPPGTGKTACLLRTIKKPNLKEALKIIYINCTSMKSATVIYNEIALQLQLMSGKNGKNSKKVIETYLKNSSKMLLLVLDEMDQLETKSQSVLYSIFEWPAIPKAQLMLIGIANALDLTDRILPRLQAKCELKPTLLQFKPYSKQQIVDIINKRLEESDVKDVFTGTAVQLLAGKVAAVSGDIRRALDICRRGVEIAESEKITKVLKPTNGVDLACSEQKQVDFKEIRSVLNGVYGGSQNVDSEESNFPLQQKLVICSLMLILNKGKNKDVNLGRLHQVYKKVCKKRNISALDVSEFTSACSLIETRGILKLLLKKEPRLSKVSLQWDQEMLTNALQDKDLTFEILNDVSCL
ncbi:cell division control protein 6 homolog [Copidosoma floridanum]|uniref:cell division control protein 6 homolog n=1 Tax=Copidosoma floridanum TaxID=29053 RepID=UPI0006C99A1E|nr:cell division control protein 6 homolog [Copidosoma floridanum]